MLYANGDIYEGDWDFDKRNGLGVSTIDYNKVYDGGWKDDKQNGYGIIKYSDGEVIFEGQWKDGCSHGIFKYADGRVYEGGWKDGEPHGKGKMTYAQGGVYDGEWKDGWHHGKGKMTYADGGVYDGEWKAGMYNGHGVEIVYRGEEKVIYDGEWKDGKLSGHGKFTHWSEGEYDGEWKDGCINGHGKCTYRYGSYEGEWIPYEFSWCGATWKGHGILTFKNGNVFDCIWSRTNVIDQGATRVHQMKNNSPAIKLANGESYYFVEDNGHYIVVKTQDDHGKFYKLYNWREKNWIIVPMPVTTAYEFLSNFLYEKFGL